MTTTRPGLAVRAKDASPRWVKDLANGVTRAFAMAGTGGLPDFLVVGTKRGGTTSLWNYLLQHPGVIGLYPQMRGRKSTDYFFANCGRSERWYRSHFPTSRQRGVVSARVGARAVSGEASPYYMWDPRLCDRIRAAVPDARILITLREPVKRAYSHYQERVGQGVEPFGFAEALAAEEGRMAGVLDRMDADPRFHSEAFDWYSYRSRGVYAPQVRRWLEAYPADQVMVFAAEDLYTDQQGTLDRVAAFLGLPPHAYPEFRRHNYIPTEPMDPGVRRELTEFYTPHNEELFTLLGRRFDWPTSRPSP